MEEELDLLELFWAFWKKKLWIAVALLVGVTFGIVYTKFIVVPEYTSTVTLILSKPTTEIAGTTTMVDSATGAITQSDILLNQKLISTYSEIMKSRRIAMTVIDNLGLDMSYEELRSGIGVSSVKDTDVMKVSITTKDPELSAKVANEMTDVFSNEVKAIYKIQNISIIDAAEVNEEPVNVSLVKNVVIFALVAFVLVAGVIFVLFYFDNSIKDEDMITKLTGLPVLATIPLFDDGKEG